MVCIGVLFSSLLSDEGVPILDFGVSFLLGVFAETGLK